MLFRFFTENDGFSTYCHVVLNKHVALNIRKNEETWRSWTFSVGSYAQSNLPTENPLFSIHSNDFSRESSHDVRRVGMTLISPKNSTSGFRPKKATGTTWNFPIFHRFPGCEPIPKSDLQHLGIHPIPGFGGDHRWRGKGPLDLG